MARSRQVKIRGHANCPLRAQCLNRGLDVIESHTFADERIAGSAEEDEADLARIEFFVAAKFFHDRGGVDSARETLWEVELFEEADDPILRDGRQPRELD